MKVYSRISRLLMSLTLITMFSGFDHVNAAATRGIGVVPIKTKQGEQVGLYKGSHALLIGVSDYKAGWPDLESIPGEMKQLERALSAKGFSVTKVSNPNARKLQSSFEDFIDKYGYDKNNRLLFFFSGHGYTRNNGNKGYLVPADAPNPKIDSRGFSRKAIRMSKVLAWARDIEAKHALFLFDSCFSGSVFKERALPDISPAIAKMTAKPVRQFITAGSSGETVPAKSTFVPVFIDAITEGLGDLNGDGYVSGMELGLHLQQKVPKHADQTPQFGKIKDYELSQGDFVFLSGKAITASRKKTQRSVSNSAKLSPSMLAREKEFWSEVKTSNDSEMIQAYLDEYPQGLYTRLAKIKLKQSRKSSGKKTSVGSRQASLLKLCRQYYFSNRLTKPAGANAVTCYKQVLSRDPSNSEAKKGLKSIEAKYGSLTRVAIERGAIDIAKKYVSRIRQINPYSMLAQELSNQISPNSDQGEFAQEYVSQINDPPRVQKEWKDMDTGMEFVWVPKGCYNMGSNKGNADEKPVHEVCVDGFWIGKYEVTQKEWKMVMAGNPSKFKKGNRYPVEQVSLEKAKKFIKTMNYNSSAKYRLPTEAEWEYACRSGGKNETYCGGNSVDLVAWNSESPQSGHRQVGSKVPNGLGIYDMSGNVLEWVSDKKDSQYYSRSPKHNPKGPRSGSKYVARGGSWINPPYGVRANNRYYFSKKTRKHNIGLRLIRVPE
ncbi:MAG: SUMF1/EgtB/PvdO family nonheme iron enzyme [Magnetococcales bacterium]|nr:SUMF1/EgtB/PvdO family nonheme iron enzyme [Magnetococcales bacterium]